MKKCPFCRAEIEENAKFCLYCMTSFEEKQEIIPPRGKNKRWLILAALLVVALIIFVAFLVFKNPNTDSNDGLDISADNASSALTLDNEQSDFEDNLSKSSKSQSTHNSTENGTFFSSSSNQNKGSDKPENNVNSVSSKASSLNSSASSNTKTSSNKSEKSSSDKPLSTTASATTTSLIASTEEIEYIYRDAKYGDDFSVSTNLENSIVITGVKTASSNGEYKIPETLGGKRVIAIMGNAFCDSTVALAVKKVIIPSTVKTIWNYAFASCYNLTDIYFCGNSIYTETQAFPEVSKRNGRLIIHCSANCNDRNLRYYKNSASNYGAEYMEWNG